MREPEAVPEVYVLSHSHGHCHPRAARLLFIGIAHVIRIMPQPFGGTNSAQSCSSSLLSEIPCVGRIELRSQLHTDSRSPCKGPLLPQYPPVGCACQLGWPVPGTAGPARMTAAARNGIVWLDTKPAHVWSNALAHTA